MIIFNDFIPKLCSKLCGFDIAGITLFPLIILCNDERGNDTLINHESIHIQQFKETLFFGGWAIYLYDFILGYIKYRNFFKAYKMIRFEQEAYHHENNFNYISKRPKYSWTKYSIF